MTYPTTPHVPPASFPPTPPSTGSSSDFEVEILNTTINPSDHWTLDYLDIAHLQPILEAIDDDGTEFISIKEANTFAVQRPKGWT